MAFGGFCFRYSELLRHVAADFVAKSWTIDHAGRHAIDIDVVLADLESKAFGDAAEAPLRGRVGKPPGPAPHSESAAHIDDLAVAPCNHSRQYSPDGVKASVHVERDDLVELVRRRLRAGLADGAGAAGDVDQDVDLTERIQRCLRGGVTLRGVGHIATDHD